MTLSFAACGEEETPPSSSAPKVEMPNGDGGSGDGGNGGGESGGGGEPAECTHTSLEGTLIKFDDLGDVCGGGLYVDICKDCQKVLLANDEPIITVCKYDGESDKCTECGLEISVQGSKSGCATTVTFDVSLNGNKLLDGFEAEGESHQWEYRVKELDEFSCGVSAVFEECLACGESKLVYTVHEGELDVEIKTVNEGGKEKEIRQSSCTECGYKETRKTTDLGCYKSTEVIVEKSGNLQYSFIVEGMDPEHSYVTTAVKCGDSCEKGVLVIKECSACYEKDFYIEKGHCYVEEKYDLSGSTPCGGYATVRKCVACNGIFSVEELPTGCIIKQLQHSYDDETYTAYADYECVNCGLKVAEVVRNVYVNSCTTEINNSITIKMGEETVLVAEQNESVKHHYYDEYDFSYGLIGNSCFDGAVETGICSDCGDKIITLILVSEKHLIEKGKESVDIPCYTECWVEECACGEKGNAYINGNCQTYPVEAGVEEINGISFTTQTFACFDCGAEFVTKEGSKEEGCVTTYYTQTVISLNGEVIYDTGIYAGTSNNHEYTRRSIPLGPSCNDNGMIRYASCEKCGYSYSKVYTYHYITETDEIDITEHGICGSSIQIKSCPCQEAVTEPYYDRDQCNFDYVYEKTEGGESWTNTCADCGFVIKEEQATEIKDCIETITYKKTYSKGGTVLYEYTRTATGETRHNLEKTYLLAGESCYDGLYEITRCVDCDYESVYRNNQCIISKSVEISLSEYGVCNGYYRYVNCPCGSAEEEVYGLYCNIAETDRKTETVDGTVYTTITYTCPDCGVVLVETNYKERELCNEYSYKIATIKMGDTVLVEDVVSKSFSLAYHEMETTVEMKGASCLDGFEKIDTCTVCGYVDIIEYYDHQTFAQYQEEGKDGCYHRIIFWECPCGEERELDVNFIDETENGYECKDCQIVIEISYLSEKNGCKAEKTKINKFYVDGVLEFTGEEIFVYDSHSLGTPVITEGEGKSIITSTCTECGTSVVQEVYVVVLEEGDWGNVCIFDFTPDADGTYTVYSSNAQIKSNFVYEEENMVLYAFYGEGKSRPSAVVELEKGKAYKYEALDYSYGATLGAIVMVQGEYGVCEGEIGEDAITVTIQNGAYTITLCPSCHMVLEIEAVTE